MVRSLPEWIEGESTSSIDDREGDHHAFVLVFEVLQESTRRSGVLERKDQRTAG